MSACSIKRSSRDIAMMESKNESSDTPDHGQVQAKSIEILQTIRTQKNRAWQARSSGTGAQPDIS
jgi:hypothetical protein